MKNETKRTPAITVETTLASMTVQIAFSDGRTIGFSVDEMTSDIRHAAMLHGFKQKLVDAAAISRNPDTGRSATIDDKYASVREVYDRLLAGSWNKGRADGQATGSGGLLFRALCIHKPTSTPEAIRIFLEKKTPKEKAALRGVTAIASIIETLKAESVKSRDVDEAALFAGLDDASPSKSNLDDPDYLAEYDDGMPN